MANYSSFPKRNYDVFLSFRGEDTRYNFTGHLYSALCRKKIKTYIDEDSLKRGDEISTGLLKAVEESKLSIIVFSENYAFSSWCLDELVHILKCRDGYGQQVVPIFYHVDPSCVRKQLGSYKIAFQNHSKRFGDAEKLRTWKVSLSRVANLSGWSTQDTRSEPKLVEAIVDDVIKKLNCTSPVFDEFKNLVGIDKPIQQIESLLEVGLLDVRMLGIWGMGGIGKTTLASVLFKKLYDQFEGHCFLANVREDWGTDRKRFNLRNKLFSQLLEENYTNSELPFIVGSPFKKERLSRKKVLVVLDDLNDEEQFEYLVGNQSCRFGLGSRIIITSRDAQLLGNQVDLMYKVEELKANDALQLFYMNAFKRSPPLPNCTQLLKEVVKHGAGVPLALKVLGSIFGSRSREKWGSQLAKLKASPKIDKIHNILMISYDGLDDVQKDIFLDIACFFKGYDRHDVERIVQDSDSFADIIIDDLVDKSLITINDENKLCMHDLIQEMGHDIVCHQSINEPEKRSRLWKAQEIIHILKKNIATAEVKGMFLDVSEIEEVHLSPAIFQGTYNLKLLKIYTSSYVEQCKVYLPQDLQCLPDALKYLHWDKYPLKSLPLSFMPQNLVELSLIKSQAEQLWDGYQKLPNLKIINLSYCKHLIQMPDLSCAPKLERIDVSFCTSLYQVPSHNVLILERLTHLNMKKCKRLREIPGNILSPSLEYLNLSGCQNLEGIPDIKENAVDVNLSGTKITRLPKSIWSCNKLEILIVRNCDGLKTLPSNICHMKSLKDLNLSGCSSLKQIPELPRTLSELHLGGTEIEEVPSSIEVLSGLKSLFLTDCKKLQRLPTSICKLKSLEGLYMGGCSKFENFPEILEPMNLKYLSLSRTKIRELTQSIEKLGKLTQLFLDFCENLEFVPSTIFKLQRFEVVDLSGYSGPLKWPQRNVGIWFNLSVLYLLDCDRVEILDWLSSSLVTRLSLRGKSADSIPTSIEKFSRLKWLSLRNWKNLRSLPQLPSSLVTLDACGCTSLETVQRPRFEKDSFPHDYGMCFFNCLRLDQNALNNIIVDAQLRILNVASLTSLETTLDPEEPDYSITRYPGNEIPEWFIYQSACSSINIKLPSNWLNDKFSGFSTCIVVAFEEHDHSNLSLKFHCEIHLKTEDGQIWKTKYFLEPEEIIHFTNTGSHTIINSDHLFLWYESRSFIACKEVVGIITDVSFHFFSVCSLYDNVYEEWNASNISESCVVKRCGVRLLYRQEAEERLGFSINNSTDEDYFDTEEDGILVRKNGIIEVFSDSDDGNGSFYDYDTKDYVDVEQVLIEYVDNDIDSTSKKDIKDEMREISCGCLSFLSLIRKIFEAVLGKQSGSDSPPSKPMLQESKEEAIQNLHAENVKLRDQNTQMLQYLQMMMLRPPLESPHLPLQMQFPDQTQQVFQFPQMTVSSLPPGFSTTYPMLSPADHHHYHHQIMQSYLPMPMGRPPSPGFPGLLPVHRFDERPSSSTQFPGSFPMHQLDERPSSSTQFPGSFPMHQLDERPSSSTQFPGSFPVHQFDERPSSSTQFPGSFPVNQFDERPSSSTQLVPEFSRRT